MQAELQSTHWLQDFPKPLVIAGPCSAESEQQMLETAAGIKNFLPQVNIFRAGIWKPRTKPNGFEGVGIVGLPWLKKVKENFGFLTATEVANAHHVDAALKAEIDILWIGARSTVNPFTVQEIAEALQGSNKIVLVKNPVNPDPALWIGALERLSNQNITKLGAIHRGFSTYQKTLYRNNPNWQVALDFRNALPNIALLIDPSHICGNRSGLFDVAQEAMNLGYEGMMIETHCNPDAAWSDARQQITPEQLGRLVSKLKMRNSSCAGFENDLIKHRARISDLDFQLMELFRQRMEIAKEIGTIKKENNMAVFQPERWKEIKNYTLEKAQNIGLSPEFAEKVLKAIHEEAIAVQNKIMNDGK